MGITTSTDGPTYAKIIGDNHGSYPYRVGLNTLKHNGEQFNTNSSCGPGGLYFCEIKNICDWMEYGDTLCIVKPVGIVVQVKKKFKTDKMEIIEMINLREGRAWKFLAEHNRNIFAYPDTMRWIAENCSDETVEYILSL